MSTTIMRYSVQRKFKPKVPILGDSTCVECGTAFTSLHTYNRLITCSEECRTVRYDRQRKIIQARFRAKHYHPPQPKICSNCNKLFTPGGTRSDSRFCSLKCGNRGRQIERTYGIKIEDYQKLLTGHDGCCDACLFPINGKLPYLDHDHLTGKVRGLVHANCNSALGFVEDNPEALENMAKYLRRK